jgi:hypothetical protein
VVSQRQERMLIAEVRGRSRYLPASDTNRPIRLPSDLARSLQYLDDGELQELQNAVNGELVRRRPRAVSKAPAGQRDKEPVPIPEGQVNLIRASAKAGLRPASIARTLGMPLSLVRRVLQTNGNS